jgi:hypothetical protein
VKQAPEDRQHGPGGIGKIRCESGSKLSPGAGLNYIEVSPGRPIALEIYAWSMYFLHPLKIWLPL